MRFVGRVHDHRLVAHARHRVDQAAIGANLDRVAGLPRLRALDLSHHLLLELDGHVLALACGPEPADHTGGAAAGRAKAIAAKRHVVTRIVELRAPIVERDPGRDDPGEDALEHHDELEAAPRDSHVRTPQVNPMIWQMEIERGSRAKAAPGAADPGSSTTSGPGERGHAHGAFTEKCRARAG